MRLAPLLMHPTRALAALCLPFVLAESSATETESVSWEMADAIVEAIELPRIPDRTFSITDYDAPEGGQRDARPAILRAIEEASRAGGGRVVIPAGTWLSKGPIHLQSRIDLHISEDATLLFGPDPEDYLPVVRTRWEGTELYGYSPLIYARDVEDVAITGKGLIDGNAGSGFHQWTRQQYDDMQRLRQMGNSGVPVKERVFGEGTFLRPSMVQFFGARRVLLDGFSQNNAPFWINHLVYTDHAVVRNLDVDSHRPNNDGVDVDSSTYVLIEHNRFRTGDDSVVVKSGRDLDGRQIARPSERVVVRHNDMGGEDGIALGSEMSGDVRYVFFTDNIMRRGLSAIRFKANEDRGGVVEHIRVRNMTVESFEKHLFWFQLTYPGLLKGGHPSTYRDIVFENFTVEHAGTFFEAHAPAEAPLQDVVIRNVEVRNVDETFVLENVENLRLENVRIADQTINGTLDWKN